MSSGQEPQAGVAGTGGISPGRRTALVSPADGLASCPDFAFSDALIALREFEAALRVYADPRNWAISRDDLNYRVVAWVGPGAEKAGIPDAMQVAREALGDGCVADRLRRRWSDVEVAP